ncbi:32562_t:CDS:2 [Gigaspora margarita]|uniref:32562_t:CDS:1 n=1 Tax=Gigaspora margarita TaxID=4874 RepID=A0ABM8VWL0_GIGMA|nr:32562_t:CDS:2 [Gigaspora margarita]
MEKSLEIEEGKAIINKFIDFHKNNSLYDVISGCYQLELNFFKDRQEDEEYFAIFKSVLINHFEDSLEKEKLFEISSMGLQEYLKLVKESDFPFEYLAKLEEFKERNNYLNLLFQEKRINEFCSKYVYRNIKRNTYYIDIKKIEPKKYHRVIDECDTLLKHFVKSLYEIKTGKDFSFTDNKKDQDIQKILEEITSFCELSELKDGLNNVIKEFSNMRNKFGKNKPPYKTEE